MPKAFHEIARWDGGLNTHFDESDIEGNELSNVSLWSVSKPGQIYTISNYAATGTPPVSAAYNSNSFSASSDKEIVTRFGFIVVESDYDIGTNQIAAVAETKYAFIVDNGGEMTIIEGLSPTVSTEIALDSLSGLGSSAPKPRMFWSEGALRICDISHGANSLVKWWGIVNYQRFTNTTDIWLNPKGEDANAEPKWVWVNASQPKPAVSSAANNNNSNFKMNHGVVITGSQTATDLYPTHSDSMGRAVNVNLQTSTTATDGGWAATSYEFGQTFVYVGNQESMISSMKIWDTSAKTEIPILSQQYWTHINVYASANDSQNYDERITGARVYIRKVGQNRRWTLFLDVDFQRGIRRNTFDDFDSVWSNTGADSGSGRYTGATPLTIKSPSPQTYESINGYSPNENMCSFETSTYGWEHATVLNRRTFLVGVRYVNDYSGASETMPDRLYYSAVAKYDTYPTTNWIDIGVNDGESFTAIEGFANRILAFKQGTLYIINVQNPNDGGWFLEAELKGMGVTSPDAITKSDQGILFANTTALFRYTGQALPERLSTKLNKADWVDDLSDASHFIQIGYDGEAEQCFIGQVGVAAGGLHGASTSVYIYDFRTGSMVKHDSYLTDGRSNFSTDPTTRSLLWIEPDGDNNQYSFKISKYAGNTLGAQHAAETEQYFVTKLEDFGTPASMKKFYNLYINLKTGGAYDFDVIVNGTTVNKASTQISAFTKIKVSLSTVANASTFQLKILNKTTTSITINGISLEYRTLYKRVS